MAAGGPQMVVRDSGPGGSEPLHLWADGPQWEYSTAPLIRTDGTPVAPPEQGDAGTALQLNDQQARPLALISLDVQFVSMRMLCTYRLSRMRNPLQGQIEQDVQQLEDTDRTNPLNAERVQDAEPSERTGCTGCGTL